LRTLRGLARLFSLIFGLAVLAFAAWAMAKDAKHASGIAAFTVLAVIGLALILAAFLPHRRFVPLSVSLLTLLLPLYVFEGLSAGNIFNDFFSSHDGRSKARVIADWRDSGERAFPAALPSHFLNNQLTVDDRTFLPLSGLPNVLTVLCQEAEGWVSYHSDRHGFNNPDQAWDVKEQVVILGDSFVHGACTGPDRIFSGLLRKRFSGTLNLGMSDNGPLLMLATLMEYLPLTSPKAVVWSYYDGNDIYRRDGVGPWRGDLEREWALPTLRDYLEHGRVQGLAQAEPQWTACMRDHLEITLSTQLVASSDGWLAAQEWDSLRRHMSLQSTFSVLRTAMTGPSVDGLSRREAERLQRDAPGINKDLRLFTLILASAHQRIVERNARAVFLYLPSIENFTRPSGTHPLRAQVVAAARQAGFTVIDMEEGFRSLGKPEMNYAFGKRGGHFSILGHQRVAEALLTELTRASPEPLR
jgi:hypothetical protein